MHPKAIASSYRRWAPVYDKSFGLVTRRGRRKAVDYINRRTGTVLEVGVGTGLSLPDYASHLQVTGVDFSREMLAKAHRKVEAEHLSHVVELRQMDARALDYPDNHFDTVVAMYLVSVVPEPERVVAEMARVCTSGGKVIIVNHFARDHGLLSVLERTFAPFDQVLGWHSDFRMERVLGEQALRVKDLRSFPPLGMFTFMELEKQGWQSTPRPAERSHFPSTAREIRSHPRSG